MANHLLSALPIANKSNKSAAPRRFSQNKYPSVRRDNNPPQIDCAIQVKNHRFRFVANQQAVTGTITFDDLADLMCVATSATAAVRLFAAIKLKSIDIWAGNSAGDASNTVQVEWFDTFLTGGSDVTRSDTAIGLNDIAHVRTSPPKGSKAEFWLNNTTGGSGNDFTICNINVPKGGVIDIVLDANLYDTDTAVSVTGAVAAATTGKTYCRALDSATGTALLVPVGYDTI